MKMKRLRKGSVLIFKEKLGERGRFLPKSEYQ
jgi:hypothetical protein